MNNRKTAYSVNTFSLSHPEWNLAVFTEHRNIEHQPPEQLLHHGGTQMSVKLKNEDFLQTEM